MSIKEKNTKNLQENILNTYLTFYSLEPFLNKNDRFKIYELFNDVCEHSIDIVGKVDKNNIEQYNTKHYNLITKLREALMESLFKN